MFKVDDKVRVIKDHKGWMVNSSDTVLTVVSEYSDDNEIRKTQISVNAVNKWPCDFELVFSSNVADPAFKLETQFLIDGRKVLINKDYIEKNQLYERVISVKELGDLI